MKDKVSVCNNFYSICDLRKVELKQRIDNQLNVMKDQKGSYIEVK